jgi:hypothetical protein
MGYIRHDAIIVTGWIGNDRVANARYEGIVQGAGSSVDQWSARFHESMRALTYTADALNFKL